MDALQTLIVEALNLMHPRFAAANGREYSAAEAAEPPAARKWRERSFLMEFYYEFRRLWDQAIPVKLGLGHLMIQGEADTGRTPDLLLWQLGEGGQADRRLGAISFSFLTNPGAVAADQALLSRFRDLPGYPQVISVLLGSRSAIPQTGLVVPAGLTVIVFDMDRWAAAVMPPQS